MLGRIVWVSILLPITLGGCASALCRFRAVGHVELASADPLLDSPPLFVVIGDAVIPLGFKGSKARSDDSFSYSLGGGAMFSSNERIDILVTRRPVKISLIDFNNFAESELAAKALHAIETQVASAYGAKVEIKPLPNRMADCLGP